MQPFSQGGKRIGSGDFAKLLAAWQLAGQFVRWGPYA
jgi:hypothetical protein